MAPTKKRSSIKKRSPKKNNLAKGAIGAGLVALVAIAYKKGLFDKLAEQLKGNTVPTIEQVPSPQKSEFTVKEHVEQKLTEGKIQEKYMLENISKVLRKPITELKAEGITNDELTMLRMNNIEIEDIKPFVKIIN